MTNVTNMSTTDSMIHTIGSTTMAAEFEELSAKADSLFGLGGNPGFGFGWDRRKREAEGSYDTVDNNRTDQVNEADEWSANFSDNYTDLANKTDKDILNFDNYYTDLASNTKEQFNFFDGNCKHFANNCTDVTSNCTDCTYPANNSTDQGTDTEEEQDIVALIDSVTLSCSGWKDPEGKLVSKYSFYGRYH